MSCECYKIGGPWIAEDPNCPTHGYAGRTGIAALEEKIKELEAKVEAYDKLVGDYDDLIEKSRKWYHDSTQWEGDVDLGPLWQELWNRRGDLSK